MKISQFLGFLIPLIISLVDLYLNYNEKYFPEYHEKRVKFNICFLLMCFMPILLIVSTFLGPCVICLNFIFLVIVGLSGFYYTVSSFYLYFAYDGSNKIKSVPIRILMWISFVSFIINITTSCFNSSQSSKKDKKDKKESNEVELEEEQKV